MNEADERDGMEAYESSRWVSRVPSLYTVQAGYWWVTDAGVVSVQDMELVVAAMTWQYEHDKRERTAR